MKYRENVIPIVSRRNKVEPEVTVYGEQLPTKRCSMCRMELLAGVDFYQTRDHEPDYAVDSLCYDLKKKYPQEWKSEKYRIQRKLRENHIGDYETRKRIFDSIFRNRGYDNAFDGA